MSDCRSFSSNYHPSSQSRKISIGVMVDSLPNRKPGPTKTNETNMPRAQILTSTTENNLETNNKDEGITAARQRNPTETPEHVSSPWRKTRSFHQKLGTLETVLCKQTSSLSGSKGMQKKFTGVQHTPVIDPVQLFPSRATFQSNDGEQTFKRRNEGKEVSPERVEEFTFANAKKVIVSNKGVAEDKADNTENRGTEALRSKLLEILGTVSSPPSHHSNSQVPEVGVNELKLDKNVDPKGIKVIKPRQNSDTIETDSESPNSNTRRPVTRYLLRKRDPTKGRHKKTKSGASSSYKHKEQETNIFSFEEGLRENFDAAVNFSSVPKNKKSPRKTVMECRKTHFPEKDEVDEIQRENYASEMAAPAEKEQTKKTSSFSSKRRCSDGCHSQYKSHFKKPQNSTNLEEESHQSQGTERVNQPSDFNVSGLSKNGDKQVELSNPLMKNSADPQDDYQSPTFGFKTPISSPSQCFTPESIPMHQSDHSPALEETRTSERTIFSFRSQKFHKAASHGSNAERELSDVLEKLRDYSSGRETSPNLNEDSEGLSESSSDERDSNKPREDSLVMEDYNYTGRRERDTYPHDSYKKSTFVFHPAKRTSDPEGTRVCEQSPTFSSPKGINESDCFQGTLGTNEEDGFGRAVTQFALALQNFERKLKSATRKKSSEILASVSEGIHLRLQNVESHILTDVGKLTSLSKSKRKHMETKFQEQQEQLRLIHEKFKDEISHQLQDFRSTLEGMEAYRYDVKGTIKKQKASHQKLIAHLEGEVESRLSDAERRITAVNESARGKMIQLKRIVAECLKDSIMD